MRCLGCGEAEATEEEITGHWVGGQMCYDTSHWCKTCLAYELKARAEELLKEIILEGDEEGMFYQMEYSRLPRGEEE